MATATACCIHMYKQLVIESDGDSFVERERRRGPERRRRGGEYEAPPNSPKNNLQLWMNTLSQSNFSSVEVRVCVCV